MLFRSNLQKSQKKYAEAIKNYKKVIKLNSNFADAYNNIGTINSILGKFEEAKKFFVKAIEINNLFSEPYKNYVQSTNIEEDDKIFNNLFLTDNPPPYPPNPPFDSIIL